MMRAAGFLASILRNRRRTAGDPRFLTYTVTFACNARCIMCDSWKKPSQDDLTLDEIEGIFRQLPRMDVVRLTGGEPFARQDLGDIARLTEDLLKPVCLHVTSNGFLTDRIVRFCEERKRNTPLLMLLSVDGMKEKHNHVRGHESAWDSVMKTLKALAPRRKELNLKLAVNQTIVDAEGADHHVRLRDMMRPRGIPVHFVMAYDASATYSLQDEVDVAPKEIGQFTTFGTDFTDETLRELLDEARDGLAGLPLQDRIAKRYYLRGIRNRLLKSEGTPNPSCVALNAHLRIFPNGDVPTCQFNSMKTGNLRQQSFREIWSGEHERMRTQRDWVRKCPGCWAECEILPNAIYTGDICREILPALVARRGGISNGRQAG